jgi:hypothetical protein
MNQRTLYRQSLASTFSTIVKGSPVKIGWRWILNCGVESLHRHVELDDDVDGEFDHE